MCENLVETTARLDKLSKEFEELRQKVQNKESIENNETGKSTLITEFPNNPITSKKAVGKSQTKTTATIAQTNNYICSESNLTMMEIFCHICNAKVKDSHTLSEHKIMCNFYCHNCKKCVEGAYDNVNIFQLKIFTFGMFRFQSKCN